jgi:FHS family glucose/mannose:H+ symporter-like MFS transporter
MTVTSASSSGDQTGPVPSRLSGLTIAAALALFAVLGITTASFGAALPALRDLYHVSAEDGSHLVSLYMLGSLLAIMAGGAAEGRLRPTTAIAILTGLFAAGCLGLGLAPNWTVLQITAALAGAGFGGLALYINTAFARAFAGRSLAMLNILNASYAAGTVAGPIVAGLLTHIGVRYLFLASGLLAIICLPAQGCGHVLTHRDPATGSASASGSRGLAMIKLLVPFAAISFLYDGIETGTGAWESTHLNWIGFSPSTAAQITAFYWAGLLAGRLILPIFISRLPLPTVILSGLLTATIGLATASLPALTPYAYTLAGFGLAPVFPAIVAWIDRVTPAPQFANSVMLSAAMIGGILWPSLIGLIAEPRLPGMIALGLAGIGVLSLLAAGNAARSHNRSWNLMLGRCPEDG